MDFAQTLYSDSGPVYKHYSITPDTIDGATYASWHQQYPLVAEIETRLYGDDPPQSLKLIGPVVLS